MKNRKGFTLIEVLIVLVIVAMLMGVLFEIYITISRITFRIELQKNVNEELLFVTDTLQNLSNRNEIDYSKYRYDTDTDEKYNLFITNGITDNLFLTWDDGEITLYGSGCGSWDCLYMDRWDEKGIQLTQETANFSGIQFKVIPFEKINYDTYESKCENPDNPKAKNAYACRNNQWFWFMTTIYTKWYDKDRWTHSVDIHVNQFFNN